MQNNLHQMKKNSCESMEKAREKKYKRRKTLYLKQNDLIPGCFFSKNYLARKLLLIKVC